MLVQHILDFITSLKQEELVSYDLRICDALIARFSKKSAQDNLSNDVQFLIACYKFRWEAIVDSENDYTCNPSSLNKKWIDLAKQLQHLTEISYLKLLIPNVINTHDFNNFTVLTKSEKDAEKETENLVDFYLGYGGKTLFTKQGFCDHLVQWEFFLSTYRTLNERKLCAVTVDELARLKVCKNTNEEYFIGKERFDNFWDFLSKKVFIRLQDQGQTPIALLPHLLELIERYYILKSNGLSFVVFKRQVESFFQRLYAYEVKDINFLYGMRVQYKKEKHYLLDLFIEMHAAKAFDLDDVIRALAECLFQFNPTLKALSPELESVYIELVRNDKPAVAISSNQSVNLAQCCALLVSLLTTQFKFFLFFGKQSVSLWDKENNVFPEAFKIYTILLPLIAANRASDVAASYDKIIKDIIIPATNDSSLYTWFTRHQSTYRWLECVQQCRLSEFGAYWFEPELLFSALTLFNTNNPRIKSRITVFLDDIINTYALDKNELMKQFRVNILFADFINELHDPHRRHLLILIKLCDIKTAKSQFLSNCTLHINEQLRLNCSKPEERSSQFFSPICRQIDHPKFDLPERVNNLSSMIADYKEQLDNFRLESGVSEQVGAYLGKISQPILTVEDREIAKNCVQTQDSIGQPT